MQPIYQGVPNDSGTPSDDDELYGGKFSTVEDMEAAYRDLESRFGEQGNELGSVRQEAGQLRDLLTDQTSESTAPELAEEAPIPMVGDQPDWDALVADPNQQAQALIDTAVNQAVDRVSDMYQQEQDNSGRRDTFYQSHPDLAPFADNVVASVNARVSQEHPDLSEDQFFARVAEESRGEVEELKSQLGVPQGRRQGSRVLSEGAPTAPQMIPENSSMGADGVLAITAEERQNLTDDAVMMEYEEAQRKKALRSGAT